MAANRESKDIDKQALRDIWMSGRGTSIKPPARLRKAASRIISKKLIEVPEVLESLRRIRDGEDKFATSAESYAARGALLSLSHRGRHRRSHVRRKLIQTDIIEQLIESSIKLDNRQKLPGGRS